MTITIIALSTITANPKNPSAKFYNLSMPELPEVEVTCQGLRKHLLGRTVENIWYSGLPLRTVFDIDRIRDDLEQKKLVAVSRRAKYLQLHFDHEALLVIHLGMTGNLGIFEQDTPRKKHDHLEWRFADGTLLRFNDSRRFGSITHVPAETVASLEKTLYRTTGPEPFSEIFNGAYLQRLARNRTVAVKQLIMTNQVVAGVGNIYANESLFRAGIRPARRIATISPSRWQGLATCIREVLSEAIACGGSTISDFVNASRETGYFQVNFRVYGRQGQPCTVCRTTIEKQMIGGRASYYCPVCQK